VAHAVAGPTAPCAHVSVMVKVRGLHVICRLQSFQAGQKHAQTQ